MQLAGQRKDVFRYCGPAKHFLSDMTINKSSEGLTSIPSIMAKKVLAHDDGHCDVSPIPTQRSMCVNDDW